MQTRHDDPEYLAELTRVMQRIGGLPPGRRRSPTLARDLRALVVLIVLGTGMVALLLAAFFTNMNWHARP